MAKHREERVNSEIKRALSEIFLLDLSLQKDNIITVFKVKTTKDLNEAKIYVSILKNREETLRKLEEATPYIRHLLGQKIKLKRIPKLEFILVDDFQFIV